MDHDQLFKQLLRTFFVEFVELFLPEVSAYLDRENLEFLDKEIFTDVAAAERHVVDLLVKARFQEGEAFFLVHVETQAAAQSAFPRRMLSYFARLHEAFDLPVCPVALLTYDNPRRAEEDTYRVGFPDRSVLEFSFRAIQLNRLNWRHFLSRPNPVAAALMAKMQIADDDRPAVKAECTRMIATLRLDPARQAVIRSFMDAYLRLSAAEMAVYNRQIAALEPPEREIVMQIVNQWEEIGEARGEARGISRTVLRQLRRRLGELPGRVDAQIAALPVPKLEELAEAILDFSSLAEIDSWLAANA